MSAQIIRDQDFPAPCKRCSEVLDRYVHFCPHCGVDRPLDTIAHTRPKPALRALGPTAAAPPVPEAAKLSASAEHAPGRAPVQPDYLQDSPFPNPGRWLFTKGFLLGSVVLALGFAAYFVVGESTRKQEAALGEPGAQAADAQSRVAAARGTPGAAATTPTAAAATADQQRDSALQNAEQCAARNDWACVREQASAALTLDPSSGQAQTLMQRAILSTGWTALDARPGSRPLTPSGSPGSHHSPLDAPPDSSNNAGQAVAAVPLPRGGSIVRLPSSRDWSPTVPAFPRRRSAPPPLPVATAADAANAAATAATAAGTDADATIPAMDATTTTAATAAPIATTAPRHRRVARPPKPANLANADANPTTAPAITRPANDDNDDVVTAQQRAILQSGWNHAVPSDAAH